MSDEIAKVVITLTPLAPTYQRVVFLSGAAPDHWQEGIDRFLSDNRHIFGPEATGSVAQTFQTHRAAYKHALRHGGEGWMWPPLTLATNAPAPQPSA